MSLLLDKEQINYFEAFIQDETRKANCHPSISPKDTDKMNLAFEYINKVDTPNNSIYSFGCSGFTTYAYYKSSNNKLYVLEFWYQDLERYSLLHDN